MPVVNIIALALQAIIALPVIGKQIEGLVASYLAWKHQREKEDVKKDLNDASDMSKAAETTEDRINAAKKWQDVLKRPRPPESPNE